MSATERHRTVGLGIGDDDLRPRLEEGDVPGDADPHERLEPLIQAVERPRTGGENGVWREAGLEDHHIRLPGFGEEYYDCGAKIHRFCEGCGDVKEFGRTCRRSSCPRCAPSWALQRASKAVSKLKALRAYINSRNDPHQFFHHLILSPPFDWYPSREEPNRETLLKVGKEFCKEFSDAGFIAYHPFRGRDGDDRGAWKDRLFNDSEWPEVFEDLRHNPHLHIILVGHKVPGGEVTKRLEAETGWVCHRITKGEESSVSIYGTEDLARVVTYCLSHVGLYRDDNGDTRAATRWFYDNREYGRDLQEIQAKTEEHREEAEVATRSVAPKTLGLAFNNLACSVEHVGEAADAADHSPKVDRKRGAVAGSLPTHDRDDPRPLDLGPGLDSWDEFSSGSSTTDADAPDQEDGDDDSPDPERCNGRMLPIGAAPRYFTDPDVKAVYERHGTLEELRETYEESKAGAYTVPEPEGDPHDEDRQSVTEWLMDAGGIDERPDPPPD